MQFAGQRTDMDLHPVGEPVNSLIKLGDDVLPDPDAILITGITPQATLQDGVTEAEFLRMFHEEVATPGTIFVGYNTVRFDDEFMRFLHYRNFYDAYEWEWQDGKGRWDLLDVVRMTRALRPDGINWPMTDDGKPTNRLELITQHNGLDHENAHDALSDVMASIAVAKLIQTKQPKLFEYLLQLRDKRAVKQFLAVNPTFLYSSSTYSSEVEKTAMVHVLHADDTQGALVYDLRHDPTEFVGLTPEALAARWSYTRDADAPPRLPVKTVKFNRCPAMSPAGVIKEVAVQQRLHITPEVAQANLKKLMATAEFAPNILKARELLDEARAAQRQDEVVDAEAALYDGGFFSDSDKQRTAAIRDAKPEELAAMHDDLHDQRLRDMLPRYKARNYPQHLTDEERAAWEQYRSRVLIDGGTHSRLAKFMHRLGELAHAEQGQDRRYILEELQLYAESIMPALD